MGGGGRLEGFWWAEGGGWRRACRDDPTELPYAGQMPAWIPLRRASSQHATRQVNSAEL